MSTSYTKTGYSKNSLFAYLSLLQTNSQGEKKLTEREREVYNAARAYNRPFTDKDLAGFMGWPINRFTGRRKGLKDKGLIRLVDENYPQDGYHVNLWEVGGIL